jgi:phosphoribosyl 1,2-cyclic phosphodiesterase
MDLQATPSPNAAGAVVRTNGKKKQTKPANPIQPYLSFGFVIQDQLVYISDVSHIPDDVWPVLSAAGGASEDGEGRQLPLLILDCLHLSPHTSHFGVQQSVEVARRIKAHRTLLIGFGHEVRLHPFAFPP